jgi:hypothetical protein
MNLANNLKLSIDLEKQVSGEQWIKITLIDELAMNQAGVDYPLDQLSQYHVREAITIAMRRLVSQAVSMGMISDCPGDLPTLTISSPQRQSDASTPLMIELDVW